VGTSVIQIMYNHLGAGISITILSVLCIAGLPLPFLVIAKGKGWRDARIHRLDLKKGRKEEKEKRRIENGQVERRGEQGELADEPG